MMSSWYRRSSNPSGSYLGMCESKGRSLIRAALMLNALLRDKHEGLNRGNADPPVIW